MQVILSGLAASGLLVQEYLQKMWYVFENVKGVKTPINPIFFPPFSIILYPL